MHVFIAGGSGTIGRPLTEALVRSGHTVTGLTRTPEKRRIIESLGARAAVADVLDAEALDRAIRDAQPTHLVAALTALPPEGPTRARHLVETNRLRIEGTKNLIESARRHRIRRIVAESFVGVYGVGGNGSPLVENHSLPPVPGGTYRNAVVAVRRLESQMERAGAAGVESVTLRYGLLYGREVPSTTAAVERIARGAMAVPRFVRGRLPFVAIDDAVRATQLALEHPGATGIYNVVDDRPVSIIEFFDRMAAVLGGRRVRRLPRWFVGLAAPVIMAMVDSHLDVSNEKMKRQLGWTPRCPTIDVGFRDLVERSITAA